jgi:hypothetical protein
LSIPTKFTFKPFPLKSATPATAFIDVVPPKVPDPVLNVKTTLAVASEPVVTVLPYVSWIVTIGCVAKATPATVLELGCVVKASFEAEPAIKSVNILAHVAEEHDDDGVDPVFVFADAKPSGSMAP